MTELIRSFLTYQKDKFLSSVLGYFKKIIKC